MILDTGPLVALADRGDARHDEARTFFEAVRAPLFLSPFVLAEVDYLIEKTLGIDAELAFLADVAASDLILQEFDASDVDACSRIIARYRDLGIGVSDASVIHLADRLGVRQIVTFDERHFRAVRTVKGDPFVLLPADADV